MIGRARGRINLSHLGAFLGGAVLATAVVAQAVPTRSSQRSQRERYRTLDTFAQAVGFISNNYVDKTDERELMYGAIVGMVRRLDAYSSFLPPRRYTRLRQDTEGEFAGVGITLSKRANRRGYPVVSEVVKRSPADRAGVRVDDILMSIDTRPTNAKKRSARSWHSVLRGRSGTRVVIEVLGKGKRRRLTLVRERVKIPTVQYFSFGTTHIAYISIKKFQEATHTDVKAAMVAAQAAARGKLRGLILDVRNNPGGLLDQSIRVADLFLEKGLIVKVRGRTASDNSTERAHKPGTFTGFPIIVLVDKGTASAAEILAGALQGNKRAKVLGLKSYGKGSVQTFLDLKDGSGLKLTTARFYTPAGPIEGRGITPDIKVEAFAPDDIMADDSESPATKAGQASRISAKLVERLEDDHQLSVAYQKLLGAAGSKPKK